MKTWRVIHPKVMIVRDYEFGSVLIGIKDPKSALKGIAVATGLLTAGVSPAIRPGARGFMCKLNLKYRI